jgi:hypothetical protein
MPAHLLRACGKFELPYYGRAVLFAQTSASVMLSLASVVLSLAWAMLEHPVMV